jgi:hypothetical protein
MSHRILYRRGNLGGAAAVAAATASLALGSRTLVASPTLSFTSQGVAHDSTGHTAAGFTSYLLTVTADPGQVVTTIDLGQNIASKNGLFGSVLQSWVPDDPAPDPTPLRRGRY